jgi:uncharacterized repeat protein (TIGR01451 family)
VLTSPGLQAALIDYIYPPDKDIVVSRTFDPADFSTVGSGDPITVTVGISNNEGVDLRGLYYSDQVPNGWTVSTVGVTVNGSSIGDYAYEQGVADEISVDFTPHRWALEVPRGGGAFSPTHPIPASGGMAEIVYRMVVVGGAGSDYVVKQEGWAGWLDAAPVGTAVFGYQYITSTLIPGFAGQPRLGLSPLMVTFTDQSLGDILTYTWDFGDGGTSTLPNPTYTYTAPGYYTVSLTVQDAYESGTLVRSRYIWAASGVCLMYLPVILK